VIEFANLGLLGGVAAAAAPVLLHIAHKRKFKRIEWGAMRFLQEMLTKRRKRLSVDHWLLLAVRIAILLAIAAALARPQWVAAGSAGERLQRTGRVAAVICLDDSLSAQALAEGVTDLERMKGLARAWIDTLRPGDEVSIVRLSQVGGNLPEPLYDLGAARDLIDATQPSALASDHAALLSAGLDRFARHFNPSAELILVSDGRADGWADGERFRAVARKLVPSGATVGTRAAPHLVLLAPPPAVGAGDLAVTGLALDRSLVAVGATAVVRIRVARTGQVAVQGVRVRVALDGRVVEERELPSDTGGVIELSVPLRFPEAGSHVVEATLAGVRDSLPMDDRRALAVEVEQRLPVLLVEGRSAPDRPLGGSLGLVAAALDPAGRGEDLFAPQRITALELNDQALAAVRVVILGDVPALDANATAALERWVAAGGGLLTIVGPDTDPELANRQWWRGGDGLLPCALAAAEDLSPAREPAGADLGHPALGGFVDAEASAWAGATVRRRIALELTGGREAGSQLAANRLLGLADGSALVVERPRGLGKSVLIATSLDGRWSDLPFKPAFVPLVRGIAAHLGATVLPPRNLMAGAQLAWIGPVEGATCAGPDGRPVSLVQGSWEGKPALLSPSLTAVGAYELRLAGRLPVRYAVALDPREAGLASAVSETVAEQLAPAALFRAETPSAVTALVAQGRGSGRDLWQFLVLIAVALVLVEGWLTRRQSAAERQVQS
jgi:hypothetical protein